MIKSLYLKNFILIDELSLEFNHGFNIFTGETGAGKSIIINSIDIVFGAKAGQSLIKTGQEKAIIELTLDLSETFNKQILADNQIDIEGNALIISREILPTTTRTRVNGSIVTQDFIKELKEQVIDIHSQHQSYTYTQPKYHIQLLDSFANDTHKTLLDGYKSEYKKYTDLTKEYESAKNASNLTEQQVEFLKFQIDEISAANISDIEEDEKLKRELEVLANAEKLKEYSYAGYFALYEDEQNISSALSSVVTTIGRASKTDSQLEPIEENLINALEVIKDCAYELRSYSEKLEVDAQKIDETNLRIDTLNKLKNKYGNTLENVLKTLESLQKEYESIEYSSQSIEKLEVEIKATRQRLEEKAKQLSLSRKAVAQALSQLITDELEKLEMPKVQFNISITQRDYKDTGIDNVEFLISTNISEPLRPLAKVASGGEISRVMLAIKTIFAKSDNLDTVIFDEIDTGISGKASQAVADAISELAKYHQIISITHQPIVAAKANRHFYVSKHQDDETKVNVHTLNEENRAKAIALLLSGEINDESLSFAKKLME